VCEYGGPIPDADHPGYERDEDVASMLGHLVRPDGRVNLVEMRELGQADDSMIEIEEFGTHPCARGGLEDATLDVGDRWHAR